VVYEALHRLGAGEARRVADDLEAKGAWEPECEACGDGSDDCDDGDGEAASRSVRRTRRADRGRERQLLRMATRTADGEGGPAPERLKAPPEPPLSRAMAPSAWSCARLRSVPRAQRRAERGAARCGAGRARHGGGGQLARAGAACGAAGGAAGGPAGAPRAEPDGAPGALHRRRRRAGAPRPRAPARGLGVLAWRACVQGLAAPGVAGSVTRAAGRGVSADRGTPHGWTRRRSVRCSPRARPRRARAARPSRAGDVSARRRARSRISSSPSLAPAARPARPGRRSVALPAPPWAPFCVFVGAPSEGAHALSWRLPPVHARRVACAGSRAGDRSLHRPPRASFHM
jgi:hypothetical protein